MALMVTRRGFLVGCAAAAFVGSRISEIAFASDAQMAEQGDVIVTVDNTDVSSFTDLLTVLATKKPGESVKVTAVDSNGHKHSYTVKLNELDVYAGS